MVVHWLKRLLTRDDAPPSPVLLRVFETTGDCPPIVDIELEWAPSGRRTERSIRTADGLCVLHWRGDEERVSIVVRSAVGRTQLAVERRENEGRVFELELATDVAVRTPSRRLSRSSPSV